MKHRHKKMTFLRKWAGIGALFILTLTLSCGKPWVGFGFSPTEKSNPQPNSDTGNTLVVYVYDLSTDESYKGLMLKDFLANPEKPFATGQVGESRKERLFPGKPLDLGKIEQKKEVKYIAVLADFIQSEGAVWKQLIDLEAEQKKYVTVVSDGNQLSVRSVKK